MFRGFFDCFLKSNIYVSKHRHEPVFSKVSCILAVRIYKVSDLVNWPGIFVPFTPANFLFNHLNSFVQDVLLVTLG